MSDVIVREWTASGYRRPPCTECRDIKRMWIRAVEVGDRPEAEAMAVAMGLHQRAAHA
ncbi:hypothetical protein [Streptomyces syringium]|uniref:hypothetical protein n=1 Tax=Streptomyces syringium TaxID=76729 RepID=UPI0034292618